MEINIFGFPPHLGKQRNIRRRQYLRISENHLESMWQEWLGTHLEPNEKYL